MKFCGECGTVVGEAATRCHACGAPVGIGNAEPVPSRPQHEERPSPRVPAIRTTPSESSGTGIAHPTGTERPVVPSSGFDPDTTVVRPTVPVPTTLPAGATGGAATVASERPKRKWVLPVVIAVALIAVAGTAIVWFLLVPNAASTPVLLEAVNAPTDQGFSHPFSDSVVASDAVHVTGLPTELTWSGGAEGLSVQPFRGDTDELYATVGVDGPGGEAPRVCDKEALRQTLERESDLAPVWIAEVGQGATVTDTLDQLTPVLLGQDTAVTEVGQSDGSRKPYQAILQAGTAVLIDRSARPRVRCATGNPLDLPDLGKDGDEKAHLSGQEWPGFSPRSVVSIVEAQQAPVSELTGVLDVHSGDLIGITLD